MRKILFCALGLLSVVACAGDKGDINRVQPGYVGKADFIDTNWYYRRTVVDAPETVGPYISIGTGDLFTIERVRWDIQESELLAYRDYEWIPGSDNGEYPGADYYGSPIAAFPIKAHFDIQYEYNPATGEKTNVISENSSDRRWFERDYMRVDWSKNLKPGLDFILPVDQLDTNGMNGGNFYVHENAATDPYRARIEPERGYMDFVVNHYVMADPLTCYYDYEFEISQAFGCGPGEIRVRHAFLKVDEEQNAGYEPLYFPDSITLKDANGNEITDPESGEVVREPIFDRFGYYRLERMTWDDLRGLTESGRLNRIIRFNIWEKSKDENGNVIPYAQRTVRPIVYYTNWDFPEELKETAGWVGAEWNRVYQCTVATLQGNACAAQVCDLSKPFTNNGCGIPDVFIVRENSCSVTAVNNYFAAHDTVRAASEAAMQQKWPSNLVEVDANLLDNWCAAAEYFSRGRDDSFAWEQAGDPRYNMINWITNITPAGFAGYGPMLGDPVNGRNVCATANLMGWTIENGATRLLEYVDYMNGILSLDDILLGNDLPVIQANGQYDPRQYTWSGDSIYGMAQGYMAQEKMDELVTRAKSFGDSFASRAVPLPNSRYYNERLNRIRGTDLLKDLVLPEELMLATNGEWRPGDSVPDELWDEAAYAMRYQDISERHARTMKLMQESTFEPMYELDSALVNLANRLSSIEDRDTRRLEIKKAYFRAVALHEIGHNLGLRHNFQGSFDALNYQRRFWDIQESDKSVAERIADGQPEYTYSSIMDYHGKANGDFQGLSYWDLSAIAFGYGQLLSTFTDQRIPGGKELAEFIKYNDYTKIPEHISGQDCSTITNPAQRQTCHADSVDLMYGRTFVPFDWNTTDKEADVAAITAHEVPHMFCSDEYNGVLPNCKTFDWGANYREIQASDYVNYKNYFIFSHYLRNRLTLDQSRVFTRAELAFGNTIMTYQWMYLYLAKDPDNFKNTDLFRDMSTAVSRGLNAMSEVVAMPRPTTYYRCVRHDLSGTDPDEVTYYTGGYIYWDPFEDVSLGTGPDHDLANNVSEYCNMDAELELGLGDSFPLFIGFSEDYVTYTLTYMGTFWDKMEVLYRLTYPAAYFPRENLTEDYRTQSVSLYRLYPAEVNDILLGLVELDRKSLGSGYSEDGHCIQPRQMVTGVTYSGDTCTTVNAKIVPALARNMQLYSVLYGQAFLTSQYDDVLDFGKHSRVALKGSPEDFFPAVSPDVAECTLPEAGRTYRAMKTTSAESRIDIAFNFVKRCSELVVDVGVAKAAYDAAKAAVAATDPASPTYNELVLDAQDKRYDWEAADASLRETEQMLRFMRQVTSAYEFGGGW